jgi:hypothetical protein
MRNSAFAETETLEHLGPLDGIDDRRGFGFQLHTCR